MDQTESIMKQAADVLKARTPLLEKAELKSFVEKYSSRSESFLDLFRSHGSPLYVFELKVFLERAEQLISAFQRVLPDVHVYYAVKSNNHPAVVQAALSAGLGLDVSSGNELELAVSCGCNRILFSGPGKTDKELALAVKHRQSVTVLIDSFGELDRLNRAALLAKTSIAAGVRVTSHEHGLWRKFGIPLDDLRRFLIRSRKCANVMMKGIQFHTSWNLNPDAQVGFIARLGECLSTLDGRCRSSIEFLDVGGGYWPVQGEWLQDAGTPTGRLRQAVSPDWWPSEMQHFRLPSVPIEEFAAQIGSAMQNHILPHVNCGVYTEPGRWLCNDAMHILLSVVDKKADDLVITDGGTNAVGWERFESDYFPVINLSRPAPFERECAIYGSLCTPHDIWGFSYFGNGIERGDILLIPTQGAYTYSLRQRFIKSLPKVVSLNSKSPSRSAELEDDFESKAK